MSHSGAVGYIGSAVGLVGPKLLSGLPSRTNRLSGKMLFLGENIICEIHMEEDLTNFICGTSSC